MKYANIEDHCPLCGSTFLVSHSIEYPGSRVEYPTKCCSCGATWVQWYYLVYAGNTDVMDKNGMEVD